MKNTYDATADVATVVALEERFSALAEAFQAARPAIDRLDEAKYAGAEWLLSQCCSNDTSTEGSLASIVEALKWLRESAGNEGAWDYRFFVESMNQTVGEGARTILEAGDDDQHMRRVEGLRQYAATATTAAR